MKGIYEIEHYMKRVGELSSENTALRTQRTEIVNTLREVCEQFPRDEHGEYPEELLDRAYDIVQSYQR